MNYGELKNSVGKWLKRTDLTDDIPELVSLFHAFANRTMRLQAMRATEFVEVAEGRATLPDGYLELVSPRSGGVGLSFGDDRNPIGQGGFGFDGNTLLLNHHFSGPIRITYYKKFPDLVADTDTNWLLTNAPDAYLFGALTEAEPFIWNDQRMPMWKARRDEALAAVVLMDERARFSGGTLEIGNPLGVHTHEEPRRGAEVIGQTNGSANDLYEFMNQELSKGF